MSHSNAEQKYLEAQGETYSTPSQLQAQQTYDESNGHAYAGAPPHALPPHGVPPPPQGFPHQAPQTMTYGAVTPPSVAQSSEQINPVLALSKRGLVDTYILAIGLGFLGAHHFYLRRYGFGVLYMFTFGLFGVGYVVDWFRVPHLVAEANHQIEFPHEVKRKSLSDAYVLWFPGGLLGNGTLLILFCCCQITCIKMQS